MPDAKPETYLRTRQIRQRYNCSAMWIERRLRDPASNFPKPIFLGRLRYWALSALERWEAEEAAKHKLKTRAA
jgi:predicted DNA-binding transcriptional regulator AlpA